MRASMKRFGLVAAILVMMGGLGACADEPMGIEEEAYTVEMDEAGGDCVWIAGQLVCRP